MDEPSPEPEFNRPAFDPQLVAEQYGLDREVLGKILEMFLSTYPQNLKELQASFASQDVLRCERAAHTLKGTLSYLTDQGCGATITEMTLAARSGDLARASALLPKLERELEAFVVEVQREARRCNDGNSSTAGK